MDVVKTQAMVFRDGLGLTIPEPEDYVRKWLAQHPGGQIFIGADSKVRGNIARYATVICLWDVGKGVWELFHRENIPAPPDRFTRLWNEVTRAVEVAQTLQNLPVPIEVHVDINSNPSFRSHQLYDASMGLITSMGFRAAGKPFSWAASSGANRHCQ